MKNAPSPTPHAFITPSLLYPPNFGTDAVLWEMVTLDVTALSIGNAVLDITIVKWKSLKRAQVV